MSDNATLVERLRAMGTKSTQEAAARIAELEAANAEHDTLRLEGLARIAELEAERERLRFALDVIRAGETANPANMASDALSRGEAYAYRSEDHGPGKKP